MQEQGGLKSVLIEVGKAVGVAVAFCLVAVLVFAFIIKVAALPSSVITPVNQVIKAAAIFLGCAVGLSNSKGWLKGGIAGVLSVIFAYIIFSLVGGGFSWSVTLLLELLFGLLAGVISGVVAVNMHK
ncbi:MAG: TIGR04086 family membrane protein [Clostridia bacterium]|nr:TIGR04086 family membrane protein [Clostridia bacterium]